MLRRPVCRARRLVASSQQIYASEQRDRWCVALAISCSVSILFVIAGVDLVPIKPIPRVVTFASDITTPQCRNLIRGELKDWKADIVLHDGAPNVGTAWVQDAYSQSELVLMSLKLAVEFLIKGGTFITKVFRSADYNSLIWVFSQLFSKVEATKPPSSRWGNPVLLTLAWLTPCALQ